MGYYTSYTLTVRGLPDDKRHDLVKEVKMLHVFEDVTGDEAWYGYAKWYDWEQDMCLLSRKFPNAVFTLHGDGEESEDLWYAYFKNGAVQYAGVELVYDEFDESKLELPPQLKNWDAPYSYQS